jgi:hypothetical protein
MTDLEWTDEPPEEGGWYWHRTNSEYMQVDDQIQHLREDFGHVYALRKTLSGKVEEAPVTHDTFEDDQWAGPIPRPSDPHQDQ